MNGIPVKSVLVDGTNEDVQINLGPLICDVGKFIILQNTLHVNICMGLTLILLNIK